MQPDRYKVPRANTSAGRQQAERRAEILSDSPSRLERQSEIEASSFKYLGSTQADEFLYAYCTLPDEASVPEVAEQEYLIQPYASANQNYFTYAPKINLTKKQFCLYRIGHFCLEILDQKHRSTYSNLHINHKS